MWSAQRDLPLSPDNMGWRKTVLTSQSKYAYLIEDQSYKKYPDSAEELTNGEILLQHREGGNHV